MPIYTKDIEFSEINDKVLSALSPPVKKWYLFIGALAMLIGAALVAWVVQVKSGMHVAGINHPVGWGVYITNFVFWVGIAHSGTLISAILFLVRSKWRDAVSRSTEAMTVFAVLIAGLFPLVHLGRLWVFYYILPYPNQRSLYPNFMSPLVLDLLAVITYLTVSIIFFYFGLIPDSAAARDKFKLSHGPHHWKTKFFSLLSLGWSGTLNQWRHYNRSYLFFAMLATPLVISVHSIVSWDFAASLLPGWHSTLFAPYFVAGAIHSGLAMALTLMIPMRKFLNIKELITEKHLHAISKLILLTTSILAYSYLVEPFIEFYSGSKFHIQFVHFRMAGQYSWMYYLFLVFNVLVPLTFLFKVFRHNIKWLFLASILMNMGMWLERYSIITTSTAHDFMPHNWGGYGPSIVEVLITIGSFSLFFFLYMLFAKFLPVISIADFKDYLLRDGHDPSLEGRGIEAVQKVNAKMGKRMYYFTSASALTRAVKKLHQSGISDMETFSPVKLEEIEETLGINKSPVSLWTVAGGLTGMASGLWLTVGSVNIYDLIAGGKPVVSMLPFLLVMFEFTVLFAAITNLVASIAYTGLYKRKIHPDYNFSFSSNLFGLLTDARHEALIEAQFPENERGEDGHEE